MKRTVLLLIVGLVAAFWVLHDFVRAPAADRGVTDSTAASTPAGQAEGAQNEPDPSLATDTDRPSTLDTVAPSATAAARGATSADAGRQLADNDAPPRPIAWQMAVSLVDALEPMVLPILAPHAPAPDRASRTGNGNWAATTREPATPAPAAPLAPEVAAMPRAPLATASNVAPAPAKITNRGTLHWRMAAVSRQGAAHWCADTIAATSTWLLRFPQAVSVVVGDSAVSASQLLVTAADPLARQVDTWRKAVAEYKPVVAVAPGNSAAPRPTAVASDLPRPSDLPKPGEPAPTPSLTPEMQELADKVHQALDNYRHQRLLNTGSQSPWEMMHRIVAYGIPTEILRDGPTGERVNAIGWLLYGGRCSGQPLVVLNNAGSPNVTVGPGLQGHPGQFLGMLAQSHVSPDSPFVLGGRTFTVRDLIEEEKATCDPQIELTFKLIALSYYLKSDAEWTSRDGQPWSISRLVQEEIRQPIRGAACGGTHRLFGLASSYKMRIRDGLPVDGQFRRAQTYIRDYQRYTLGTLRNVDGSFSTDWFARPADSGNVARKIQTTGHILEWLVFSLEDNQLQDPRVVHTVDFIATTLVNNPDRDWSVGPLGHALHALLLYDQRVFRAAAVENAPQVAARADLKRVEQRTSTGIETDKSSESKPATLPIWNIPLAPKSSPGAVSRRQSSDRSAQGDY